MKFMITWQLHQGKLHDTLAQFSKMTPAQDEALAGNRVKLIGRWHDLAKGRGVAIFESDSAAALFKYALNWNRFMDLEVTPVLDDAEARAIGQT
jgi:hypothetical protein